MPRIAFAAALCFFASASRADVLFSAVPVSDGATDNNISYPNTGRKVATAPDGTIYVVYYGLTNGIRVARSTDRGESFAPSVQVDADSTEVEIAADAEGVVHVAWGDSGEIKYSRSTDDGATFSAPAVVGSTTAGVHMAVASSWVYLVPRNGSNLYRNGTKGVGSFQATSTGGAWVFADVHVDPTTGDVVVVVDNPAVSYFTSTDHGATLSGAVTPGGSVFYSTAVFAATATNRHAYVGGNGGSGLRIDIDARTSTDITLGTTTNNQGRTLAVDAFNNVVDGYVDGAEVKFAVSSDNGATFDAPITVATADFLSIAINRHYGDIVVAYQTGGQIFCNVYGSLILQPPSVTTADATNVTATTATGGGEVIGDGGDVVTARGVCWNTTGDPTTSDAISAAGSGTGAFTAALAGLTPQTTYHVRAYATNSIGTAYGDEVTFTTSASPSPPAVTTAAVSEITATIATCGGEVTSDGGAAVTARGVCWSTSPAPTTADNKTSDGDGTGAFVSMLTGLTPGTTYAVRAYAVNSAGTSYGDAVPFTTTAEAPAGEAPAVQAPAAEAPSAAPDLRIAVTSSTSQADVGEVLSYRVVVQNLGTAGATGVVLRVALPSSAEFVSASLVAEPAAQSAPLDALLDGQELVLNLGDVAVGQDLEIEIVLRAKASGEIALVAAATSNESGAPVTAQAEANVQVDDVYWEVIDTLAPVRLCGWMGFTPALVLAGLMGLKRRGSGRWYAPLAAGGARRRRAASPLRRRSYR